MSQDPAGVARPRAARRTALRLAAALALLLAAAPPASAAGVGVTTPFPTIVAEPGGPVGFDLRLTVPTAQRLDLEVAGVPDGWSASFRGAGLVIDAAYVVPGDPPGVTLVVEIPEEAPDGTTPLTVRVEGASGSATLAIAVRVAAAAAGDVALEAAFPELRGPSTSTFTFSVTLDNGTAADATFSFDAVGPSGWDVTARPAGQAQATSIEVAAGGSTTLTVAATPPSEVEAGTYGITLAVNGAGRTISRELVVLVTGTYSLLVTTPDEVLSATANAGSGRTIQVLVRNTGTAPVTGIAPTASTPTNWTVTWDAEVVPQLEPGEEVTLTATMVPSPDAIAGDYELVLSADGEEAQDSVAFRVRVETPQAWFIVGLALLGAVVAGLAWVFRTYGRR